MTTKTKRLIVSYNTKRFQFSFYILPIHKFYFAMPIMSGCIVDICFDNLKVNSKILLT